MNNLKDVDVKSLAISLSGGGHRASLFTLGTLMYLVDAEANERVTSIASVSGGSLTNGFVGQTLDFKNTNGDDFRRLVARPLATQIAKFGTLFAPLLTKVYVALLIVGLILAVTIPIWMPIAWYLRILLFLVLLVAWGWLFGKRGAVCARAFNTTLFSPNGRATTLAQIEKNDLDHVICATELRSAEQVYFASDFIYSFWLGHGVPAKLPLARAVQASACFPVGFPPTNLATKQHHFTDAPSMSGGPPKPPNKMVLMDGGVYDNMGDQWARGFRERVRRWEDLGKGRRAPEQLIVVNASARIAWNPFREVLVPLFGELAAINRVLDVLYINTTNVRRQNIVASYDPDEPVPASVIPSVLVQIAQSPYAVADFYARRTTSVAQRAQAVLKMLGDTPENKKEWAKIASDNSIVATSLSKFKPEVTARLMYQGYIVAMCNLHVLFGEEFPLRPQELAFKRFRELIS
jgi:predicted acylesterase/phospholipase RssA